MMLIAVLLLSAIIFMLGVSIYAALVVAKKTDQLIWQSLREDEQTGAFSVRFPESVFKLS